MAASDLQTMLAQPDFKADAETQKRLVATVLKQLDDTSGDITSIAVKWCGPRDPAPCRRRWPLPMLPIDESCLRGTMRDGDLSRCDLPLNTLSGKPAAVRTRMGLSTSDQNRRGWAGAHHGFVPGMRTEMRLPWTCRSGGVLVRALDEAQLKLLLEQLCERCTRAGKKGERRDIAAIGLKTVVGEISDDKQAATLVDVVTPTLIKGIASKVRAGRVGCSSIWSFSWEAAASSVGWSWQL